MSYGQCMVNKGRCSVKDFITGLLDRPAGSAFYWPCKDTGWGLAKAVFSD